MVENTINWKNKKCSLTCEDIFAFGVAFSKTFLNIDLSFDLQTKFCLKSFA